MTEVLASRTVIPLHGEIVVQAEGATQVPIPETGEEKVVVSAEVLLVATRGDNDGDVLIEVCHGCDGPELGEQVFDGELSFTSPRLVFGSLLANELGSLDIGRIGWVPLKVFVSPPEAPSRVVVML